MAANASKLTVVMNSSTYPLPFPVFMKSFFHRGLIMLSAVFPFSEVWAITTVSWGSPLDSVFVDSHGNVLGNDFSFELGSFANDFIPTASNIADWSVNWRVFDRAFYSVSDGYFSGSAEILATGFSNSPDASVAFDFSQKNAYLWVYNQQTPEFWVSEWMLVRDDTWTFPVKAADCCPTSLPIEWSLSDLSSSDAPVFGEQAGISGGGSSLNTTSNSLETYTLVPEIRSLPVIMAVILLSGLHRRRLARKVSLGLVVCLSLGGITPVRAERLNWSSALNSVDITSSGAPLDGSFRFELGVFADGFVPTAGNTAQWSSKWHPAQRVSYNATNRWFSSLFEVVDNAPPFIQGAKGYIWGFRGDEVAGEWILFSRSTWTWPSPNPFNPNIRTWNAKDADTVVLGTIQSNGEPFLMRTAAVSSSLPPPTYWIDWVDEELAGVALKSPTDDPDQDGVPNLLEYVFGTSPNQAEWFSAATGEWVTEGEVRWFQLRIPRRRDRPALLSVEVSTDMKVWNSGEGMTQVVEDSPGWLVVRDLGSSASHDRRFLRLRALPITP